MKKLTEVKVNQRRHDAIISYFMQPNKDDHGGIIYTKPEELIAKCKGNAHRVLIYVMDENEIVVPIGIDAGSIKRLYHEIMEIEALESEEFCD